MMTPAYNPTYLNKVSRAMGNMLHDAVYELGLDGAKFLRLFIQSGIAEQIENGNPKYVAGKSGLELLCDILEITSGKKPDVGIIESYDRSDVYWVGWILAHYQWYSGRSFRDILEVIPYRELLGLYGALHEADVQKAYEVFNAHFAGEPTKLQKMRKRCNLTQEDLAEAAGVPVSTIRAYERKAKDISKAQADSILRLANVLNCEIGDILE